jgi:hypothetical protein
MRTMAVASLVASTVLLGACGMDDDELSFASLEEALSSVDDNGVVSRDGDGLFKSSMGVDVVITPSGPSESWYNDWGYWFDIKVKNLTYDKSVGIIWTEDNWATAHVSYAAYEGGIDGSYERWGVDLTGRSYSGSPPTIEYATFAQMGDVVYYGKDDNWKNYVVRP